jgi:hypothetical protein
MTGSTLVSARSAPPGPNATALSPRMRLFLAAVTAGILVFPVVDVVRAALRPQFNGYGAIDYTLYMEATTRWLAGGSFYEPYQLAGPYPLQMGDILYPPTGLLLFAPFTVLPAVLWWVVPLGVTGWAVWRLQPSPVAWPFLALCLFWPPFVARVVAGNPVMWVMAAVALACLIRWPAVLVLLKPSLFPFALIGIRRRSWWVALLAFLALSLPFGAMWVDWYHAITNASGGGLFYSLQDVPILLLPVVAWRLR